MAESYSSQYSRRPGQYRNAGFDAQVGEWRERVTEQIQSKEVVFGALQTLIEAGAVLPDPYYVSLADDLQKLRQDLDFIQSEEHKW
jgi:hypothetical protein